MSELKLLPCPFCGGRASQPASTSPSDERCGYNFVAYVECSACGVSTRTESNHDKGGWCNESIESAKSRAVKKWNSRTQPEATKPAQDLGAAILALPLPDALSTNTSYRAGFRAAREAAAALASPADALVAGDRVNAAKDVLAERERQKQQEGWTAEHDDQYEDGELCCAAACYTMANDSAQYEESPNLWPWPEDWWKPTTERRNLVKAGALILAEIERLDRAAIQAQKDGHGPTTDAPQAKGSEVDCG